jgi:hypothetical protein
VDVIGPAMEQDDRASCSRPGVRIVYPQLARVDPGLPSGSPGSPASSRSRQSPNGPACDDPGSLRASSAATGRAARRDAELVARQCHARSPRISCEEGAGQVGRSTAISLAAG